MGVRENVGYTVFPKQSQDLGKDVNVCFLYDTNNMIRGKLVRSDIEAPFKTIIVLDDGRYILSTECQYQIRHLNNDHGGK
jgi:hypothetical protein